MATESAGSPRPFDVHTVEYLIGLMARHDLAEIALQEGEQRIRLRKAVAPAAPPSAPAAAPAAAPAPPDAPPARKLLDIKSEMVGTLYTKPKPDKDDYVTVGSKVTPDMVVCQIEAMKIFNEMPAGVAGTVAEVCVKNGEPVDFGRVLFRVEPA